MKVCWDTNLFIYNFEDYGELSRQTEALFDRMLTRDDVLVASALTLGELLVVPGAPHPVGDVADLEAQLREIALVIPFDEVAARWFAQIRADRSIAPADAINLACAAAAGADLFVTNDARLTRKIVPGVPILTSLEAVPI